MLQLYYSHIWCWKVRTGYKVIVIEQRDIAKWHRKTPNRTLPYFLVGRGCDHIHMEHLSYVA